MSEATIAIVAAIVVFVLGALNGNRVKKSTTAVMKKAQDILSGQQEEVMTDARKELNDRIKKLDYARKNRTDLTPKQRAAIVVERAELQRRLDKIRVDAK